MRREQNTQHDTRVIWFIIIIIIIIIFFYSDTYRGTWKFAISIFLEKG